MAQVPVKGRDREGIGIATRLRLALAVLLALACPVLMALFAVAGASFFPAYRQLSRALMGALAHATAASPVAIWDIALPLAATIALVSLVRRARAGKSLLAWLSWVLLAGALVAFAFVGGWALNHYGPTLADELGLEVGECSEDQLADATARYLADAARIARDVPRDQDGALSRQDFFELARVSGAAYGPLGERWDVFRGSTTPVKALLVAGEPLLWSGHVGVFTPPTGEASVPLNCATAELGFTMCHEAAHRLAIASEDEANFCAYLACEASDDVRLRYSGSYSAFCWCLGALLRANPERAQLVVQGVADEGLADGVSLVLADRAATREHYAAYEGPAKEAGTAMNDAYLKTFGESAGVRSYGLVADYLIAWNEVS